jgi:serine/threonine-protein kinase
MAEVFRAETDIGKVVALKILRPDLTGDPDTSLRFLEEAKLAAKFNHPNVVAVYHCGEEQGRPYMEMEFLEGHGLAEIITNPEKLADTGEQLRIAIQLAEALRCVHALNALHRDVKPSNVYICNSGTVKLIDFGIAKTADSFVQTAAGFSVGTPLYMAPEQILAKPASRQTDIYAFGLVLYELTTKTRAVSGNSIVEVSHRVLKEPLDMAPARARNVPESVIALIESCTAKQVSERPSSFTEVSEKLQACLREVESRAAPPAGARVSRPRTAVWAAMAFIVAVAAALSWQWLNARESDSSRNAGADRGAVYPAEALHLTSGDMRLVDGGPFLFGAANDSRNLPAFYIDVHEVTNGAYAMYARATGRKFRPGPDDHPVVDVNIAEARAFCQWAGKRLPTALEWEKAARGTQGWLYPWGGQPDDTRARVNSGTVNAVGAYPQGASPFGALDMLGNVWEFVDTPHTPNAEEIAHIGGTADEPWVKVYGGAFDGPLSRVWDAAAVPARLADANLGFRCAADAPFGQNSSSLR